jgi:hypothetical protein
MSLRKSLHSFIASGRALSWYFFFIHRQCRSRLKVAINLSDDTNGGKRPRTELCGRVGSPGRLRGGLNPVAGSGGQCAQESDAKRAHDDTLDDWCPLLPAHCDFPFHWLCYLYAGEADKRRKAQVLIACSGGRSWSRSPRTPSPPYDGPQGWPRAAADCHGEG